MEGQFSCTSSTPLPCLGLPTTAHATTSHAAATTVAAKATLAALVGAQTVQVTAVVMRVDRVVTPAIRVIRSEVVGVVGEDAQCQQAGNREFHRIFLSCYFWLFR